MLNIVLNKKYVNTFSRLLFFLLNKCKNLFIEQRSHLPLNTYLFYIYTYFSNFLAHDKFPGRNFCF